ncbi:MAG: hypothetical protein WC841_02885 [Candidatus Shapirobacteria bacterium]|jgi:hypothetical protein
MTDNNIPKQVLQAIKQIGMETVEQGVKQVAQIGNTIITGKELLGDITPMTEGQLQQKRAEDDKKRQEEAERIRGEMGQGRNVGAEIKQIQDQKKQDEDEKERQFLENLKRQREAEKREQEEMAAQYGSEGNKKKKGPQRQGKRKPSMVDQSMEQAKKPD